MGASSPPHRPDRRPPRRSRWSLATWAVVTAIGVLAGTVTAAAADPDPLGEVVRAVGSDGSQGSFTATMSPSFVAADVCLAAPDPGTLFDSEPAGIVGADSQRSLPLPDGRTLWTFQDAAMHDGAGGFRIIHNIGAVQNGSCFRLLLGGSPSSPAPWLFAEETTPGVRWFWPLDATVGVDGAVYVFLAEMREFGEEYLERTEPVRTVVAGVAADTLTVQSLGRPANASVSLYGWSIASDHDWTYLYAHCHRQFGFDPWIFVLGHDLSCTATVTLARVPKGFVFATPEYWTGAGWTRDPRGAVPVFPTQDRLSNPVDVVFHNNRFHAVTKVHDWWGDQIIVERADRAFGPFETVAQWTEPPKCPVECNTYHASFSQTADPDVLLLGLSHNRWDGIPTAVYRPTFRPFAVPSSQPRPADRCAAGQCG